MNVADAVRVSDATHGHRCHYTSLKKKIKYSQGNGMVLYLERAFYFCVFPFWGVINYVAYTTYDILCARHQHRYLGWRIHPFIQNQNRLILVL